MTEREKFEEWAKQYNLPVHDSVIGENGYLHHITRWAWNGWQARAQSPQVPEGMALVPVDLISKALHGLEHLKADIQDRSKMQEDYQEGVVMVGAGAWHALCSAILMLAAAKEQGND